LEIEVAERTSELMLEQRRLQAIFDATGEGVFYLEDFRFQYVNPAFCRLLGYRADELVGQSLSVVYPELVDPVTATPSGLLDR
ncbi:PAS domain-containing protein, partial [Klebsiella pneumoniae]|uniref:PAS domain-containing protein n=1 Tax=Klebsiella pneumoniae TaxID=573 RepID=UPI00272FDD2F